jgi:hypothetical protein
MISQTMIMGISILKIRETLKGDQEEEDQEEEDHLQEVLFQEAHILQFQDSHILLTDILFQYIAIIQFIMGLMEDICSF